MEAKKKAINLLLAIQDQLTEDNSVKSVQEQLKEAQNIFACLLNSGYTEELSDHIISYCHQRIEYAITLLHHDEVKEGVALAKSVITYYSKNAHLENQAE